MVEDILIKIIIRLGLNWITFTVFSIDLNKS
jgi:hypothetical protein